MHRRPLPLLALLVALAPAAASAQGLLVPREPGLSPLAIGHQRVKVEIRDGTAVTHVDQTFVNRTGRVLEAEYLFPVPKGAAVQDFALWINGKKTKGEVLEKDKARGIYEGIVRRMRDPGLLEYVGGELFRARVYPIPARGEQRIQIAFSQVLDFADGIYTYRYPLGAARVGGAGHLKTLKDFTFTGDITSKAPVKTVYSPSHKVDVRRGDDHSASFGFEDPGADLSRDVVLYYSVGRGDVGMNLLTYKEDGEAGYFVLMAAPKQDWQRDEVVGKVVTFVIDTSGSMARGKLKSAKEAIRYALARMQPEDRFNIVRFSTDVETFRRAPVRASAANLKRANAFVRGFYPAGGTAIHDALLTALREHRGTQDAPHLVVFLTDGEPTVGLTDEKRLAADVSKRNTDKARIFVFGVGNDLKATLLDRLASESGGSVEYARDGKETETKLSAFYNKIAFPVLTDVSIDLGDARAFDVYPRSAPALFKGSQLIVVGRYRDTGKHEVTLSGRTSGEARDFAETLRFPKTAEEHDFIPRLWAVRKVGYLLEEIRLNGERPELRDEVIRLGKKFGIVTPYTSYLVVEDEPSQPMVGPDRRMPAILPTPKAGSSTAAGREEAKRMRRSAAAPKPKAEALADDFDASTGAAGVAASQAIKDLKESESAAPEVGTRTAGARTFVWKDGAWTDTAFAPGLKVLKVKYLSEAYFALLRLRPGLKDALALGERVRVALGHGQALEIGEKGVTGEKEVRVFLGR